MKRRLFVLGAVAGTLGAPGFAAASLPTVHVFKNPSCGCCGAWVDHLKAAGFRVDVTEVADTAPVRQRHGIPEALGSCHTGVVAGYALEGHVPAADVKRLLAQKPAAAGLAVPGMPVGSPGMEVGDRKDAYQVLLVDRKGGSTVFASHGQAAPAADRPAQVAQAAPPAADLLSEGEVRKVDAANGKITLRHGPIANLDMPGMTMVFTAADRRLLAGVKQGDKVRFTAGQAKDGTYLVTALRVVN